MHGKIPVPGESPLDRGPQVDSGGVGVTGQNESRAGGHDDQGAVPRSGIGGCCFGHGTRLNHGFRGLPTTAIVTLIFTLLTRGLYSRLEGTFISGTPTFHGCRVARR